MYISNAEEEDHEMSHSVSLWINNAVIFPGKEDSVAVEEPCAQAEVHYACGEDRVDESTSSTETYDSQKDEFL